MSLAGGWVVVAALVQEWSNRGLPIVFDDVEMLKNETATAMPMAAYTQNCCLVGMSTIWVSICLYVFIHARKKGKNTAPHAILDGG